MAKKSTGIIKKLQKEGKKSERSIKSLQKRIDFLYFLSGRMIYKDGLGSLEEIDSKNSILKAYFRRIDRLEEKQKAAGKARKAIFDKNGEVHYDNISAFIKSMRGSDADATLFYLARAINGGEDPMFLARRIVICASEDVGLANPNALVVATSAMQAVSMVGMPEARIILSEAAVYVATSPKAAGSKKNDAN